MSNIFGECFVPITYGGGISTLDQAKKIINLGAEKICIQQEAFKNKNFISELSKKFGSQVVLILILKKIYLANINYGTILTINTIR